MRLQRITATPHPFGNRIDLTWAHPNPAQYPGVRVVRREGTHPASPQPASPREGVVVADTNPTSPEQSRVTVGVDGLYHATDANLRGETVYYYTLFPYAGDPPVYDLDRHNRAAAMATAPYDMAGQMADLLPTIYQRYDTVLPRPDAPVAEADRAKGQLRRFLDLPAGQLDQLYSFARAMLDLSNLDKVDGRLLPLLAQWIAWPIDFRLDLAAQRNEIRNAPHLYKTIGIIPTVEATVKRTLGLESRTKEFVHNLFRSNQPERLNLWARQRDRAGAWSESSAMLSLDFAYEGRPTAVRDGEGTLWLFYHTLKKGRWDIWYKTHRDDQGWAPSQVFTQGRLVNKFPTAAVQGDTLWLFWSAYDLAARTWLIRFSRRRDSQWSPIEPLPLGDPDTPRRQPWAVADDAGGLWLFWLEQTGGRWQLRYNRHDGTDWALTSAAIFPVDAGADPRVESAPFVLFHPRDAEQPLWVFWARKEAIGVPDQSRWRVVYRVKTSLDPRAVDWSPVRALPSEARDAHDREPAALVDAEGNIELFWSSTREGSWSVWQATLNRATHNWGPAASVPHNPYSQRDPLPIAGEPGTLLLYRSNESLLYTSEVYGATETVDARYAGCTSVDTRNLAKIALRRQFADFQTYTYDVGRLGQRTDQDWYARDTVGVYVPPGEARRLSRGDSQQVPSDLLSQFLPIQVRAVFIAEPTGSE